MRILHTSDWHLGRALFNRKRYEEFDQFLSWLTQTIKDQSIDVLIIAGDIFDTGTPSNQAQQQYFNFLKGIIGTQCRHVVVVGGNHDSPSFLNAPQAILRMLDVHVVGCALEDAQEEVLQLFAKDGQTELIVCAVPYLRDRDVRLSEAGETTETKDIKLVQGIKAHYQAVGEKALALQTSLGGQVPIVGTGHLFATGGQVGDGVRELYVGNLGRLDAATFPECMNYVALGHLHIPQPVAGHEHIRYCGSPLAMGFGEAGQQKEVCIVEFNGLAPRIERLHVPRFQALARISGDWDAIEGGLKKLAREGQKVWVEVSYTGKAIIADLSQQIRDLVDGTPVDVLKINNPPAVAAALQRTHSDERLEDLNETEVFERCLQANEVPEEQRVDLRATYQEALKLCQEADKQAE